MLHGFHLPTWLEQIGQKNDVAKRIPWPNKYAWFSGAKIIIPIWQWLILKKNEFNENADLLDLSKNQEKRWNGARNVTSSKTKFTVGLKIMSPDVEK